MAIPKAPIIIIVLAFAAVAALAFLISLNPAGFGGIADIKSTNKVTEEATEKLVENLESGDVVQMVFPPRTVYSPGDTFSAALGINNRYNAEKIFYINVIQDSGPENGPVLLYDKNTGPLAPRENKVIDIVAITYFNTPAEAYSYTIVVCTEESCSLDSPGFYYQLKMNFRIR